MDLYFKDSQVASSKLFLLEYLRFLPYFFPQQALFLVCYTTNDLQAA